MSEKFPTISPNESPEIYQKEFAAREILELGNFLAKMDNVPQDIKERLVEAISQLGTTWSNKEKEFKNAR